MNINNNVLCMCNIYKWIWEVFLFFLFFLQESKYNLPLSGNFLTTLVLLLCLQLRVLLFNLDVHWCKNPSVVHPSCQTCGCPIKSVISGTESMLMWKTASPIVIKTRENSQQQFSRLSRSSSQTFSGYVWVCLPLFSFQQRLLTP